MITHESRPNGTASEDQVGDEIKASVTPTADNPPPLSMEQARLVAAILFGGAR